MNQDPRNPPQGKDVVAEAEKFFNDAVSIANKLIEYEHRTYEVKSDDGKQIVGWLYDRKDRENETESVSRGYGTEIVSENWGHSEWYLTTEGEFYLKTFYGEDSKDGNGKWQTDLNTSLWVVSLTELRGAKGAPFSDVRRKLDDIVLQAYENSKRKTSKSPSLDQSVSNQPDVGASEKDYVSGKEEKSWTRNRLELMFQRISESESG